MDILRIISKRTVTLSAIDIPRVGFGEVELTGKVATGIATEVQLRTFRLPSCGCVIQTPNQVSGICFLCRAELAVWNSEITFEERDWLASVCLRHFRRCVCGGGTCPQHAGIDEDGRYYCLPHHLERMRELEAARLEESSGIVVARVQELFDSFFVNR